MRVDLTTQVNIARLHFSQIMVDIEDVESSNTYVVVVDQIDFPEEGGFLNVPQEFIDNFIIGLLDFSTNQTQAALYFNWEFISSPTFGVEVELSVPYASLQYQSALTRQGVTLFYIKTWYSPALYYLNLATDLCT